MTTLVLGAGVVGICTAYFLNAGGESVEVIERREAAGMETSWGNGGVIHASEIEPWSQPGMPRKILGWLGQEGAPLLLRPRAIPRMWRWGLAFARNCETGRFRAHCESNLALALHSLAMLQAIRIRESLIYDYAARGVLKVYRDPAALDGSAAACDRLVPLGLSYGRLSAAEAVQREPALSDVAHELAGALYFPRDEVGDSNTFAQALAAVCASRGVRFRFDTSVTGVRTDAGKVTGVTTSSGVLPGDRVVVCLGSFSTPLLRDTGLRVPVYPVKGVSITFLRGGWNGAPSRPVIDDSRLFGLVPIGNRMRVSGSAEIDGYDATPSERRGAAIVANATATFPSLAAHYKREAAVLWGGLRPVTPAGTPLIGQTNVAGLC